MKFPEYLFHYTVGPKMPMIALSGVLRPNRQTITTSLREKAILWWSENPQWEPTANKVLSRDGGLTFERPSLQELMRLASVFRFRLSCRNPEALRAVGIKLLPFQQLGLVARVDRRDMNDMVQRGLKFGATPAHWWGTLEEVPLTLEARDVLTIEAREPTASGQGQTKWVRVTMEQAIASFQSRGQRIAMTTPTVTPGASNV
jgi:hypothetical protein